ncbi:hypothetical protein, partial [Niveispirillum sp.]|uniref:hypothetical protein n=1 Tax=Niveispirillum sp. TaxID=1917217 RepID=UPI001B6D1B8B
MLATDKPANGTFPLTKAHGAGGRCVQAHFMLDAKAVDVIAPLVTADPIRQPFRDQEQERPRLPGGPSGRRASTRCRMLSVRS